MKMVSKTEEDPCKNVCNDCCNEYMSEGLVVENFKAFKPVIIIEDCDGIKHRFEIRKEIHDIGILWEAKEFIDGNIGYSFMVLQKVENDSKKALKRLKEKIKKGLSQKYIKKITTLQGYQYWALKEVVEGRIERDDKYDGRIPKFIIDGEEYTAKEMVQMLMEYSGWNFELKIKYLTG